jgi:hypothetical protein
MVPTVPGAVENVISAFPLAPGVRLTTTAWWAPAGSRNDAGSAVAQAALEVTVMGTSSPLPSFQIMYSARVEPIGRAVLAQVKTSLKPGGVDRACVAL